MTGRRSGGEGGGTLRLSSQSPSHPSSRLLTPPGPLTDLKASFMDTPALSSTLRGKKPWGLAWRGSPTFITAGEIDVFLLPHSSPWLLRSTPRLSVALLSQSLHSASPSTSAPTPSSSRSSPSASSRSDTRTIAFPPSSPTSSFLTLWDLSSPPRPLLTSRDGQSQEGSL